MSMNIYAGKIKTSTDGQEYLGPVIDFDCWDFDMLAADADARSERGDDPFVVNPKYVEHAGMNLSNDNAEALCAQLGLPLEDGAGADFPIDDVYRAAMRGRNGSAAAHTEDATTTIGARGATFHHAGIRDGYMEQKIDALLAMIVTARPLGATTIVFA